VSAVRTVFLNGEFMPADRALISPLDRGFVFGDGVYEVIPAYGRRPFRLGEHLERLRHSLAGVRIAPPYPDERLAAVLEELVARHPEPEQSIYLQITRGVAPRDHAFPRDVTPTVFAMSNPLSPVPAEIRERGVAAITLDDIRWEYCHLKTTALLPNVLLRQQALDAGAAEAILVRRGEVSEGAASNLFIVLDGVLITPPKGPRLLPGITRDLVLEIAVQRGIACREAAITPGELARAEEVWLTSSTREILPVTRLDGRPVGGGVPGPLWTRMIALYQDYKRACRDDEPSHGTTR
jgi:D-alanine transaminase